VLESLIVGVTFMAGVMEMGSMAKAKSGAGRPKKPSGQGAQIRVDFDLATKARYLAAERGITVLELVSGILRPVIDRDFRKAAPRIDE
jgi:hypothetical protein